MQNYKVFIDNDLIFFGKKDDLSSTSIGWSDFQEVKPNEIESLVNKIKSSSKIGYCNIETDTPEKEFTIFCSHFLKLQAAGGFVFNKKDEILMIHRFQHWDFPKGKVEKGESISDAAIREVMEETGLKAATILKKLPCAYHIYRYSETWILKETHWFLMESENQSNLKPQLEEEILAAVWVPIDFLSEYMAQSYESLRELVRDCELIR